MSFPETLGYALIALLSLFALIFVLAAVEGRMFDEVLTEPEADVADLSVVDPAAELGRAA